MGPRDTQQRQQEALAGQNKELGQPALGDQQDPAEVVDSYDPKDKEATEALPATQLKIDKHHFDCVGSAPDSLLDVRQRQSSAGSYGLTVQTGLILGSAKTIYECQCYGCLANDPSGFGPHRKNRTLCEFTVCTVAGAVKAGNFSSA